MVLLSSLLRWLVWSARLAIAIVVILVVPVVPSLVASLLSVVSLGGIIVRTPGIEVTVSPLVLEVDGALVCICRMRPLAVLALVLRSLLAFALALCLGFLLLKLLSLAFLALSGA